MREEEVDDGQVAIQRGQVESSPAVIVEYVYPGMMLEEDVGHSCVATSTGF